jgi:hypothetical protein
MKPKPLLDCRQTPQKCNPDQEIRYRDDSSSRRCGYNVLSDDVVSEQFEAREFHKATAKTGPFLVQVDQVSGNDGRKTPDADIIRRQRDTQADALCPNPQAIATATSKIKILLIFPLDNCPKLGEGA